MAQTAEQKAIPLWAASESAHPMDSMPLARAASIASGFTVNRNLQIGNRESDEVTRV